MDDARLDRIRYLLGLLQLELDQLNEPDDALTRRREEIVKAISAFDYNIRMTGPSGFNPQPTFEKCDRCDHYRLKK